jgi:pimeloyl-ACP methyl ester carboxylesterase
MRDPAHTESELVPTVFALHGIAVTPDIWNDLRQAAPDLPMLAPDLIALVERGDGTLARLVRDLVAMAPPGPIVLVGSSYGAQLALELGPELGDRVVGILLLAPGPAEMDDDFFVRVRGLLRVLEHWNAEVARSLPPLLLYRFGPRYAHNVGRLMRMFSVAAERSAAMLALARGFRNASVTLPLQPAPVRVLVGADNANPITAVGVYESWRQAVGEAVERIPSASEYIQLDQPELLADAIRAMCAAHANRA